MFRPKGTIVVFLVVALTIIAPPVRAQEIVQANRSQWKMVFDSERDTKREIYVMDADGGGCDISGLAHLNGCGGH